MLKRFSAVLVWLMIVCADTSGQINVYVSPSGSNGNNGQSWATAWQTVQYAIDNSASGDIINVAAGTYVEDLSIPASKTNLELAGAGIGLTTIKGVQHVPASSSPLAMPNIEVLGSGAKIHGFTIEGPDYAAGFYASGMVIGGSNVEVNGNAFKVPNSSAADFSEVSQGIQTYRDGNNGAGDLSGLSIHNNTFTSLGVGAYGYEGIFINHTLTTAGTVTISNNQFTGNVVRGITTERSKTTISNNSIVTDNLIANAFQGINVKDYGNPAIRPQSDVAVTGNVVKGSASGNGFSIGVRIGAATQVLSSISVQNNVVQMNAVGINVVASAGGVVVNDNDLSGNSTNAVKNDDAAALDATNNWWGSAAGPNVAANTFNKALQQGVVVGTVTFVPWWSTVSGTAGSLAGTSFAPVTGIGSYSSIQAAINAASVSTTVTAVAGTFTEDLSIPASKTGLELAGAGSGSTTIQGIANVPAASFPLAVPNIEIRASGVKVHGFTIKGPNHVANYYASGMVIGATGVEIHDNAFEVTSADNLNEVSQGIQTYSTTAVPGVDISGLYIHNNTFTNLGVNAAGYEGIYINPDAQTSTVMVTENTFSGAIVRAITTERSKTTISDNSIVTDLTPGDGTTGFGYQGINVTGSGTVSAVAITGNTVKGSASGKGFKWGLNVGPSTAITYTSLTVSNNIIETNETGIRVRQSANGITVSDNSISGNTVIGIQNDDVSHTLDASGNWWGSVNGPTHASNTFNVGSQGNGVSDHVVFVPWLNAIPPGGVSFAPLTTSLPVGSFASIQAGIGASNAGGTVNVAAGTYSETVTVNKAITLTGSGTPIIENLTMNPGPLTLGGNFQVSGTLTFTSGNITTGANTLILGTGGTVAHASGHVVGNFRKSVVTGATSLTFEIGDASNYTPVDVSFASVTTAGALTARTTAGDHPDIGSSAINPAKSVHRYWTLTNGGIVFTTYNATFTFVSGDKDAGTNTNNFVVGKRDGSTWTYPTVGTRTATSTGATGMTSFSDFQLGEAASSTSINVWYGPNQTFGQIGIPQRWINILGNVSDPQGITSLTYSLNGGPSVALSIGPDTRRLNAPGDFNADIDRSSLVSGANQVIITATNGLGATKKDTVTIQYVSGHVWPLPYSIDWSSAQSIPAVAQIVDGLWTVQGGSLRPVATGYDRLVAIGDVTWTDYEVTVPITIHGIDSVSGDYARDGAGLGIVMRWNGHTDNPWPGFQPKAGYLPIGADGWYDLNPKNRTLMIGGNGSTLASTSRALAFEVTYDFKMHVETISGQGSLYKFKVWQSDQVEPTAWDLTGQAAPADPASGSFLLAAHNVDASFGNVTVVPVLVDATPSPTTSTITAAPTSITADGNSTSTITVQLKNASGVNLIGGNDIVTLSTTAGTLSAVTNPGNGTRTATLTSATVPGTAIISGTVNGAPIVSTATVNFATPSGPPTLVSDGFNESSLNTSVWSFVNPRGDATLGMTGSQVSISVPGGVAHDAWRDGNFVPRIVQPVGNIDFDVELKFDAAMTQQFQSEGVEILQDGGNYLRFEFHSDGGNIKIFVATFADSIPTQKVDSVIASNGSAPLYMRVARAGNQWTQSYSRNGLNWTVGASFPYSLAIDSVAPYVGNAQLNPGNNPPAFTGLIDYFIAMGNAIAASAHGPGTITPSGTVIVKRGTDTTFTLTPTTVDDQLDSLLVDGVKVTPTTPTTYKFTNVQANHAIVAYFSAVQDTILASAHGSGTITPSGTVLVNRGKDTTFTITPSIGAHIDSVVVDGANLGGVTTHTFTNVTTNHTIAAYFSSPILVSDGFNESSLNTSVWSFVNPRGDATLGMTGSQVSISVPGGVAHDAWRDGNFVPRIVQPVGNIDFDVELKFDAAMTQQFQSEGVEILQDGGNYLRFEFHSDGGNIKIFVATFADSIPTQKVDSVIASNGSAPLYMRVARAGNQWTQSYSRNGLNWTVGASFPYSLAIDSVAPYVGNAQLNPGNNPPAFTGLIDYFIAMGNAIAASAHGPGTITPSGTVIVKRGTDTTFTLTPTTVDDQLDSLLVDGVKVTPTTPTTYKFTNVQANHAIVAYFSAKPITVNLKAYLQGPYVTSSDSMKTSLLQQGYVPLKQPYGGSPWNYSGTDSVTSVPSGVVDWVLVEVRTGTSAASKVATRAAFIKRDGSIVGLDGVSPVAFANLAAGNYYVVVRHRNHLAIMTASAVALSSSSSLYNFTTSQNAAYSTDYGLYPPMKDLGNGKFGMYAGDVNGDGTVYYLGPGNDRGALLAGIGGSVNGMASGYISQDVNLDGSAYYLGPSNDRGIILVSIGGAVNGRVYSGLPEVTKP
jgi:hypothetical protein